jgi:hypothetical protein
VCLFEFPDKLLTGATGVDVRCGSAWWTDNWSPVSESQIVRTTTLTTVRHSYHAREGITCVLKRISVTSQYSKWAGMCRYTIPEFLCVPKFYTGPYQYIFYLFIFVHFWRNILVSLLRSIPALLNFHLEHCIMWNGFRRRILSCKNHGVTCYGPVVLYTQTNKQTNKYNIHVQIINILLLSSPFVIAVTDSFKVFCFEGLC